MLTIIRPAWGQDIIPDAGTIDMTFIEADCSCIQPGPDWLLLQHKFLAQIWSGAGCSGSAVKGSSDPLRLPIVFFEQTHFPPGRGTFHFLSGFIPYSNL